MIQLYVASVQAGTQLSQALPCLEDTAMVVLAGAMDFGSSWRDELRSFHGKGAWPTVFWRPKFSCVRVGSNKHVIYIGCTCMYSVYFNQL